MSTNRPNTIQDVRDDHAERVTYDAVREAIEAGWDARRFRETAAEAWEQHLRDDARAAVRELSRSAA